MVYPNPMYYNGFDKPNTQAFPWDDHLWDSHIDLPVDIVANQTRYMQQCFELEERSKPL